MNKENKPPHEINRFIQDLQSVLLSRCWDKKDPELKEEIDITIACMIELEITTYQGHPGVDDLVKIVLGLEIITWLRETIKAQEDEKR